MANIGIVSLGCDKNLVDSEVMLGLLMEKGHTITEEHEADAVVVNTCCFIEDALKESIENILELGSLKKENGVKIIVTGCLAERYKEKIFGELPEVDVIVGAADYGRIAEAVENALSGGGKQLFGNVCGEEISLKRRLSVTGSHYAYLKIAEGCDNHCSYCIIPKLRGAYRSRTFESLLAEADALARNGVKELILVAQDTGRYGSDIYGEVRLPELLRALCRIDGIEWVRLMYCYPENVSSELIRVLAEEPKIVKYIDIPIQHISDKILKLMGRGTDSAQIKGIINDLREKIEGVTIRTSLITGFPGEADEDFNELLEFIKEYRLERVGVFPFSREEGAPAYDMKPRVSKKLAVKRKNALMREQKRIAAERCESLIGKTMEVIVEGRLAESGAYRKDIRRLEEPSSRSENTEVYVCRSYMDAPGVDSYVFIEREEELLTGDFTKTEIIGYHGYDLWGA